MNWLIKIGVFDGLFPDYGKVLLRNDLGDTWHRFTRDIVPNSTAFGIGVNTI